jgi:hypothetical protein
VAGALPQYDPISIVNWKIMLKCYQSFFFLIFVTRVKDFNAKGQNIIIKALIRSKLA